MKIFSIIIALLMSINLVYSQSKYEGKVLSAETAEPISDVYIVQGKEKILFLTDSTGVFQFVSTENTIKVVFRKIGLKSQEILLMGNSKPVDIWMESSDNNLDEVIISTGYQKMPKERATGAFHFVDNQLLNRSVSTDIISRLEGIVPGLQFDRRQINNSNIGSGYRNLRLRGIATLNASNTPLIVLDNFPFEGDLNTINPNDIDNVTILKDAAAASIWGARAGNGVIVITTKNGKYNSTPNFNFSANIIVQPKPDVFYSDRHLESGTFLDVEKQLYNQGFYKNSIADPNHRAITPAVELWNLYDTGQISEQELYRHLENYKNNDIRKEAYKYLYRQTINSQYSLSSNGGGEKFRYFFSGGFDKNIEEVVGNNFKRYTINLSNHFRPFKFLEISAGVAYNRSEREDNGISLFDIKGKKYPYASLADGSGNAVSIPYNHALTYAQAAVSEGLLNWEYKPLEERNLNDNKTSLTEFRINLGARVDFQFFKGLTLDLKYFAQTSANNEKQLRYADSYWVRDLVNRFTQGDLTKVFPQGDILKMISRNSFSNNFRGQFSYIRGPKQNSINILAGFEARENKSTAYGFEQYGFDKDILIYSNILDYATFYSTRPLGTARIPIPDFTTADQTDRFLSFYSNAAYELKGKYIFSGSLRWDASNLFGVKTNQKGVPLWSSGILWKLKEESFIKFKNVDHLDLRVTIGQNGNLNRSASALPVAMYLSDQLTRLQRAVIRNPGNPQLRWEKVSTANLGLDFSIFGHRIFGSAEYYIKKSSDLLGSPLVDPTVGYKSDDSWMRFLVNYAGLITRGIDLEVNTSNIRGKVNWQTTLQVGHTKNKVTDYQQVGVNSVLYYTNNVALTPVLGKPFDAIFSIPWNGLDPSTGDPLVYLEGIPTTNFSAYFNTLTLADLTYSGVTVPPWFGSIRNTISYKGLSLSVNLTWKTGYVFRRSSIDYGSLFSSGNGHVDFQKRWTKPGDEIFTSVPSMPSGLNNTRDYIYLFSEALIEKGDHIRFQDINIAYDLNRKLKNLRIFLYGNNFGIIWKKTKSTMDPDYPNAFLPPNRTVSLGLKINIK